MAMRLSGLMSGMDTESIVSQLVEARRVKVDNKVKAQTKLEWKQDAWKELNTKLKNLQSKFINNMRFSTAYAKKTTKVSDSSAVSVITGESAVNGVQYLKVDSLAKAGYLTGGQVSAEDENGDAKQVTALATMKDLGFSGEGTFKVDIGGTNKGEVKVGESTTISDVLNQLKGYGLNASFDTTNQRFFISSKTTGEKADFKIYADTADGNDALAKLGLQTTDYYSKLAYQTEADGTFSKDANGNLIAKTTADYADDIQATVQSRLDSYTAQYNKLAAQKSEYGTMKEELTNGGEAHGNYSEILGLITQLESSSLSDEDRETVNSNIADKLSALKADLENTEDEDDKANLQADIEKLTTLQGKAAEQSSLDSQMNDIKAVVDIVDDGNGGYKAVEKAGKNITAEVTAEYAARLSEAAELAKSDVSGATKIDGADAVVYLNGAKFTNNSNVFQINGLTITANATTDSEITLTTQTDTDGIYDMIKNFLKEYNSVINEIDKLYNADSAKGYEPLTDEEKDAMSDAEVEKYEKKIKDSLLRRDENLNSVGSALREMMSSGFAVGGTTMYLSDFGINTLGYFNAADNEKNAYHIDGDEDDADTSGKTDKLKAMIASDPDAVINFFSSLSKGLYEKMNSLSTSVNGYRSYGSFYDDKKMKTDYDDYTTKIKEMEQKLNDYEDKWYKKFSKMETAMAKMQSNSNAVAGLLGGGS